jgi:serine/threonine protein kinase/tetratricopeptide (TPR) repeat protein
MDTRRHSQIKKLFLEACERPRAEREAFIGQACGDDPDLAQEVESLLAFHTEDAAGTLQQPGDTAPGGEIPDHIGPYKVLRRLGEGGMGVVYEVEREEPIRRRLALKVIKWGMDTAETLARFESERQALALMNHTNVAAVYEAGATVEGRPYFAMEYVEGESIVDYCDRQRLHTRERLELFLQVCEGVQHAHRRGIIHRDLKPSNVLVTEAGGRPVPKIIDFGVAKAIHQPLTTRTLFTATGVLIGTPQYMSPEQAELSGLDVDTRTDVYSLGMILYGLLVGELPFDTPLREAGFDEIRRVLRECEPPKPSTRVTSRGDGSAEVAGNRGTDQPTLERQIRGDLDWITMRALERDRNRRYGSVAALAADIRRHLRHEPVLAGPPSKRYRVQRFVRRHRAGVAAAVVVAVAVLAGLALSTVGLRRARHEAETARRVSEYLSSTFVDLNPVFMREVVDTPEGLLRRAVEKLDTDLEGQPLAQARVLTTLGATYAARDHAEDAKALLERAVAIRREHLGGDHVDTVMSTSTLADLLMAEGDHAEARRLHSHALEVRQRELGPGDAQVGWSYRSVAACEAQMGNFDRAIELFGKAIEIGLGVLEPDDLDPGRREALRTDLALTQSSLGGVEMEMGDFERARPRLEQAVATLEQTRGSEHPWVADALFQLGLLQSRSGELEEARASLERSLAIREKVLGTEHRAVAYPLNELAVVLTHQGDLDAAGALLERALAIRSRLGLDHPDISWTLIAFGSLYRKKDEDEKAREHYRRALEIQERAFGESHHHLAWTLGTLAHLEAEQGNLMVARPLLERQVAILRTTFFTGHRRMAVPLYNLGCVLAMLGEEAGALEALREAADSGYASTWILKDPDLDSLRGDTEFETVAAEVAQRAGR